MQNFHVPIASQHNLPTTKGTSIRCVIISDTHGFHNQIPLPSGQILIHAGDFTDYGTPNEIFAFKAFLKEQLAHFEHIVIIPGNHEFWPDLCATCFFSPINPLDSKRVHYLRDEVVEVLGINFYGSRFKSATLFGWMYPVGRDRDAKQSFDDVPLDKKIDVMLIHQPPYLKSFDKRFFRRGNKAITEVLMKVNPAVYICGHNHDVYGVRYAKHSQDLSQTLHTTFICACSVDGDVGNKKLRNPIVFDYIVEDPEVNNQPDQADNEISLQTI